MANRQTKRERKEEARRARLEAQRRAARRRRMRRVWSILVALAVIGAAVFLINLSGKSAREKTQAINTVARAAKCGPVEEPKNEGQEHIAPPQQATYEVNPPTTGPHYNAPPQGPIPSGVHVNPVRFEGLVHNLEHGHIGIVYKPTVSQEVRTALEQVASDDNRWYVAAPNDTMPVNLAFLAWGRRITCDGTGTPEALAKVAREFGAAFKDQAPESGPGTPNR